MMVVGGGGVGERGVISAVLDVNTGGGDQVDFKTEDAKDSGMPAVPGMGRSGLSGYFYEDKVSKSRGLFA